MVISKTYGFETTPINWYCLPAIAQTWQTFRTNFTTTRRFLKKLRGKTEWSAGFHHANIMASNLNNVCEDILEEVYHVQTNVIEPMMDSPPQVDEILNPTPPQIYTANAEISDQELADLTNVISNLATPIACL